MKELNIAAVPEMLEEVTEFINAELCAVDCPVKAKTQIDIAVDEIFSNIAYYAYAPNKDNATVRFESVEEPPAAVITFIDRGKPYNPLTRPDPDITLPADQRKPGGLGIYMVKNSMDSVEYEYRDGQNILSIKKSWVN